MSAIKFGDNLRRNHEFDAAPIGTVVQGRFGVRVKTSLASDGYGWIYAESGQENSLSTLDAYTVLFVPPVPEKDELSAQLWEVRNEALIGTAWEFDTERPNGVHKQVYDRLAGFVLDNFERVS